MPEDKDNSKPGLESRNESTQNGDGGLIQEIPDFRVQRNDAVLQDDEVAPVFFTKMISVPDIFTTDTTQNSITHEITLQVNNFADNNIFKETEDNHSIDIPGPGMKYIHEIENTASAKETKAVNEEIKPAINLTPAESPDLPDVKSFESAVSTGKSEIHQPELVKSEIENPKSEIKSHHPAVEKKGLKEYLPEGLMIFIAVMIGFFAQNLRNYITENKTEQQYAMALYTDLKADTAELTNYVKNTNSSEANTNTLVQPLSASGAKPLPSGKLYWVTLAAGVNLKFIPHDASRLKMKNSLSQRYFVNADLYKQLSNYNQMCGTLGALQANNIGVFIEVRKAKGQGYDKAPFNVYLEIARKRLLLRKVNQADTVLSHATSLIAALKKQYSFDKEAQ